MGGGAGNRPWQRYFCLMIWVAFCKAGKEASRRITSRCRQQPAAAVVGATRAHACCRTLLSHGTNFIMSTPAPMSAVITCAVCWVTVRGQKEGRRGRVEMGVRQRVHYFAGQPTLLLR